MSNRYTPTLLLALPFVVAIAPAFANREAAIQPTASQSARSTEQAEARVPALTAAAAAIEHFVARAPVDGDPAGASRIEILIQRWSTDAERDDLRDTLVKDGPKGLLTVLHKVQRRPVGVVVIPGIPGGGARVRTRQARNVLFARSLETAKGRQVVIATDQSLAFGEPTKDWSSDYEFTLLDIRFGPDGAGTGKLAPAARVVYNKATKTIELGDYTAEPVRLNDVRSETTTATRSRREAPSR